MHTRDTICFAVATIVIALAGCCFAAEHSELLQGRINRGEPIPAEQFRADTTLVLPFASGGSITGAGSSSVEQGKQLAGPATRIIAQHSGPVIVWHGTYQTVTGLAINGGGEAGCGIQLKKPYKGLGTGKGEIKNVYFDSLPVGVRSGTGEHMHNGDCMVMRDCRFKRVDTCVEINNTMGMGWKIENCYAQSGCKTFLDVTHGGTIWLDRIDIMGPLSHIVKLNGGMGRNNNCYWITGVKSDSQAWKGGNKLYAVHDDDGNSWAKVYFDKCKFSGQAPYFRLAGPKKLTLRDCDFIDLSRFELSASRRGHPLVVIDNCETIGSIPDRFRDWIREK